MDNADTSPDTSAQVLPVFSMQTQRIEYTPTAADVSGFLPLDYAPLVRNRKTGRLFRAAQFDMFQHLGGTTR